MQKFYNLVPRQTVRIVGFIMHGSRSFRDMPTEGTVNMTFNLTKINNPIGFCMYLYGVEVKCAMWSTMMTTWTRSIALIFR